LRRRRDAARFWHDSTHGHRPVRACHGQLRRSDVRKQGIGQQSAQLGTLGREHAHHAYIVATAVGDRTHLVGKHSARGVPGWIAVVRQTVVDGRPTNVTHNGIVIHKRVGGEMVTHREVGDRKSIRKGVVAWRRLVHAEAFQ